MMRLPTKISKSRSRKTAADLQIIRRRLRKTGDFISQLAPPAGTDRPREKKRGRDIASDILRAIHCLRRALARKNQVLIFGNGGSAAAAQHLASELVNRLRRERAALPALALTADSSVITSISNDREFRFIFSRQLEALARPGDVALAISTSGRSPNIVQALKTARTLKLSRIALLGGNGGPALRLAEFPILVSGQPAPLTQEIHLIVAHLIAELLENDLLS